MNIICCKQVMLVKILRKQNEEEKYSDLEEKFTNKKVLDEQGLVIKTLQREDEEVCLLVPQVKKIMSKL